jgi:histidinol dehydrogenase
LGYSEPFSLPDCLSAVLAISRIDARRPEGLQALDSLRRKLSPQGDVVSPRSRQLTEAVFGAPLTPAEVVRRICSDIRDRGDQALLEYSAKLDDAPLDASRLRVEAATLAEAHRQASSPLLETIRRIRDRIHAFQTSILHRETTSHPSPGVLLQQRYVPLRRIGVCVPGGAAAYPSTILMTVVPALAAGVESIVVVAPPTPFGAEHPDILATCHELGVQEVYRIGGAQGVAAMAYGTATIPAVDKIVGPGNLFVALAKKHVYGEVDIDSIAGPSEVVVVADQSSRPDWVAADLLAQAEHSPASAILISWDPSLIDSVASALAQQVVTLERDALTRSSLEEFSALVLVRDRQQAIELTDLIAPEHLHLQCDDAMGMSRQLRHAGAIFVGPHTPVALGDYAAGPSHVLPTGGTARWAAGLSSNAFLRSHSVMQFDPQALGDIADDVQRLAAVEGLTAHAKSVSIRLPEST